MKPILRKRDRARQKGEERNEDLFTKSSSANSHRAVQLSLCRKKRRFVSAGIDSAASTIGSFTKRSRQSYHTLPFMNINFKNIKDQFVRLSENILQSSNYYIPFYFLVFIFLYIYIYIERARADKIATDHKRYTSPKSYIRINYF